MRPQVFASTVFVLLQRRAKPNPLLCAPLPPVGLKCFFNTIDVFTRYLKRGKSDTLKTHSLLVKHFCNSPYSLCNSASYEIIFSPPIRDLNAAKHACQYNLGSNLVFSFNGILAFLDTRLAKFYIRHCLHGGGITFLKGLPF